MTELIYKNKHIECSDKYDAAAYALEHNYSNDKGWRLFSQGIEIPDCEWPELAEYLK